MCRGDGGGGGSVCVCGSGGIVTSKICTGTDGVAPGDSQPAGEPTEGVLSLTYACVLDTHWSRSRVFGLAVRQVVRQ